MMVEGHVSEYPTMQLFWKSQTHSVNDIIMILTEYLDFRFTLF